MIGLGEIDAVQSAPDPATLRAALDGVFAGRAYRWAETPAPLRFMREWWDRLADWLDALRLGNPAAFRLFVFALLIGLVLVQALYGHVFGGRPCAPDDYRRWRETSAGPWHAAAH